MVKIGEDRSERLDIVPAQFRVIATVRPRYACPACQGGIVQAPTHPWLIEGGLPTEGAIAHVLVAKYADHAPLYRQCQIMRRAGLALDRSTLAGWVGKAAFHLAPVVDRLAVHLKGSGKLFMDETRAPVLDPGRGETKSGFLWALARDDRRMGRRRSAGGRLLLCRGPWRRSCRALPRRLPRHPAGGCLCRLQPADPGRPSGRTAGAGELLGARPAQAARGLRARRLDDRGRGSAAHRRVLPDRGRGPRPVARGPPRRAAAADGAAGAGVQALAEGDAGARLREIPPGREARLHRPQLGRAGGLPDRRPRRDRLQRRRE